MRDISVTAMILASVLLGAGGQIFLKLGASSPGFAGTLGSGNLLALALRIVSTPGIVIGLVLYGISTLLWLGILARTELSFAYPFISIGFVVTTLFGWWALDESVTIYRLLGVSLIILGVVLVARS